MESGTKLVAQLMRMLDGYDPRLAIIEGERKRGFRVVSPGDTEWFPLADWKPASVASLHGMTARLVLLDAVSPRHGAFKRLVSALSEANYTALVISPTREFAEALSRKGWRGAQQGSKFDDRETIWRLRLRFEKTESRDV